MVVEKKHSAETAEAMEIKERSEKCKDEVELFDWLLCNGGAGVAINLRTQEI